MNKKLNRHRNDDDLFRSTEFIYETNAGGTSTGTNNSFLDTIPVMFHPVVIMFSLELVAEEIILLDMGTLGGGYLKLKLMLVSLIVARSPDPKLRMLIGEQHSAVKQIR